MALVYQTFINGILTAYIGNIYMFVKISLIANISEISQTAKDEYHMVSPICRIFKKMNS